MLPGGLFRVPFFLRRTGWHSGHHAFFNACLQRRNCRPLASTSYILGTGTERSTLGSYASSPFEASFPSSRTVTPKGPSESESESGSTSVIFRRLAARLGWTRGVARLSARAIARSASRRASSAATWSSSPRVSMGARSSSNPSRSVRSTSLNAATSVLSASFSVLSASHSRVRTSTRVEHAASRLVT